MTVRIASSRHPVHAPPADPYEAAAAAAGGLIAASILGLPAGATWVMAGGAGAAYLILKQIAGWRIHRR
jgi:hypothetical protein